MNQARKNTKIEKSMSGVNERCYCNAVKNKLDFQKQTIKMRDHNGIYMKKINRSKVIQVLVFSKNNSKRLIDQKLFKFQYFLKIIQTRGYNETANNF